LIKTVCPKCKSGAVGSKPALIFKTFLRLSLSFSSSSGKISSVPRWKILLILIILLLIGFIIAMTALGHKDIIIPVLSFVAGALGGFGYGRKH
jgi:hypothetical protein